LKTLYRFYRIYIKKRRVLSHSTAHICNKFSTTLKNNLHKKNKLRSALLTNNSLSTKAKKNMLKKFHRMTKDINIVKSGPTKRTMPKSPNFYVTPSRYFHSRVLNTKLDTRVPGVKLEDKIKVFDFLRWENKLIF
jgi:hypothetical protein